MSGAPLSAQANALLRKSLTLQKRNVGGNCCLISAPIILCIILGVVQVAINGLIGNNKDLQCGCQCLSCCTVATGLCVKSTEYCNIKNDEYTCSSYDKKKCSLQYSSAIQSAFCAVASPSSWPAVMQVPSSKYRAGRAVAPFLEPQGGAAQMLVTGASSTLTSSLSANLFQPLDLSNPATLSALSAALGGSVSGTFSGYLLSQAGFTFGTNSDLQNQIYVEQAFTSASSLYIMLPGTACIQHGLTTKKVTFSAFLAAYMGVPLNQTGGGSSLLVTCVDAPIIAPATQAAANRLLYCGFHQARCDGTDVYNEYSAAWNWQATTQSHLQLNVQYNSTEAMEQGTQNDPNSICQRLPELINLAVRSWWYHYTGDSTQAVQLLGVKSMPTQATLLHLDFSSLLGPLFFTWIVQLLLPTILQQLVYEKEKRLRIMMKMHGLGDGAYWLITYAWYFGLYSVYITVLCVFGGILRLKIFTFTDIAIQLVFYFLYGNCMIAFAFMLSSLFSSSRTAVTVAFLYVFASGLIGELLLSPFMDQGSTWVFYAEWIPAWALYRGLYEMGSYTFLAVYQGESKGLQFKNLSDHNCGMLATWGIFVVEWALFMVLAWYFEQVLSDGTGIRRHWLFFLQRKKSADEQARALEMSAIAAGSGPSIGAASQLPLKQPLNNDLAALDVDEREDVRAERLRVEAGVDPQQHPIIVRNIRKIYPGLDGGPPKLAVRSLTLAIERGECFGLLGPNGAGKTTSINMLVGFLEPTSGSATVEGLDIMTEMGSIYNKMGVCPQHDLLWDTVTGREHLLFYGRLKGLKGVELEQAVESGLRAVNLWLGGVADKHSAKYSGGMKRRLSVAISFIGNPRVVYLDEPSTGLDPASRRNLWEVVKGNKAGRATILTTHSMEEAEMLCDRLGIFVDGQLVCIGNPKEITNRYAGYLVFQLMVPNGNEAEAKKLVLAMSPGAKLTYGLGGSLKYELPTSEVTLSKVFNTMAEAKAGGMTVLDWGVSNATLEEVFIKFARMVGASTKD